jgi:enoyl-CoA hydratase/carnithine racemase
MAVGEAESGPEADKVLAGKKGRAGSITFNNPEKRNAVSLRMWQRVGELLTQFATDDDVRVVVMSGAGGKAFVSGADISKFESERAGEEAAAKYTATQDRMYEIIRNFDKPIIAKIDGYCIGGGVGLAVTCDMRICSDRSTFSIPAAKLGIGYNYKAIGRLVDLVGPAFAREIFLTGRMFSAVASYEMRLVKRFVPDAELDSYVETYAEGISQNAPLTIQAARYAITQIMTPESERDIDGCAERIKRCTESHDYVEGRRAFMEKRKPGFTGK